MDQLKLLIDQNFLKSKKDDIKIYGQINQNDNTIRTNLIQNIEKSNSENSPRSNPVSLNICQIGINKISEINKILI